MTLIVLGAISAAVYFAFLCYMVWKVFCNISIKRSVLPSMSKVRRIHYEGIIYRFKFLMLATLLCALLTIIGFILGQVTDSQWHWNDNVEIEFSSAFFTGGKLSTDDEDGYYLRSSSKQLSEKKSSSILKNYFALIVEGFWNVGLLMGGWKRLLYFLRLRIIKS